MPDLPTRLIDATTRPFSDNAELQLAASRLLETLSSSTDPAGPQAIRRWDTIDSRRRKRDGRPSRRFEDRGEPGSTTTT